MIGSSKNSTENYPRKCFWTHEKETRVKFNPRLSANRPSNNWALSNVSFIKRVNYTTATKGLLNQPSILCWLNLSPWTKEQVLLIKLKVKDFDPRWVQI